MDEKELTKEVSVNASISPLVRDISFRGELTIFDEVEVLLSIG